MRCSVLFFCSSLGNFLANKQRKKNAYFLISKCKTTPFSWSHFKRTHFTCSCICSPWVLLLWRGRCRRCSVLSSSANSVAQVICAATKSGSNSNDNRRARLRERCIICALKSCVRCATTYMVMIWAVIAGTIVATNSRRLHKIQWSAVGLLFFFLFVCFGSSFHFVCKCDERNDSIWSCVRIFLSENAHEKKDTKFNAFRVECRFPLRLSFRSTWMFAFFSLLSCVRWNRVFNKNPFPKWSIVLKMHTICAQV